MSENRPDESLVSRDPLASKAERMADKAHDPVIVLNHFIDPTYAPYCMRCGGLQRMKVLAPFLWEHEPCGAVHDERQVLMTDSSPSQNELPIDADKLKAGLLALSDAFVKGRQGYYGMRIPAEPYRDGDLVCGGAYRLIERLQRELAEEKRATECCKNAQAQDEEIETLKKQLSARLQQIEELRMAERLNVETVARLQQERDQLRIKYANMFSALNAKQAKIDALMLEFCPGEMSAEQRAEWTQAQRSPPEPSPSASNDEVSNERLVELLAACIFQSETGGHADGYVAFLCDVATVCMELQRRRAVSESGVHSLCSRTALDEFLAKYWPDLELRERSAQPPNASRTDEDYAIEHGRYLADAVDAYIAAHSARNVSEVIGESTQAENDAVTDCWVAMRDRVYEFRKRADRAAATKETPRISFPDDMSMAESHGDPRINDETDACPQCASTSKSNPFLVVRGRNLLTVCPNGWHAQSESGDAP